MHTAVELGNMIILIIIAYNNMFHYASIGILGYVGYLKNTVNWMRYYKQHNYNWLLVFSTVCQILNTVFESI